VEKNKTKKNRCGGFSSSLIQRDEGGKGVWDNILSGISGQSLIERLEKVGFLITTENAGKELIEGKNMGGSQIRTRNASTDRKRKFSSTDEKK